MDDRFQNHLPGLESPAVRLEAVVPNDDADLSVASRAIAVGTEGFVNLTTIAGTTGRVFVVPGAPFPIRARRILATGTTAGQIVSLA